MATTPRLAAILAGDVAGQTDGGGRGGYARGDLRRWSGHIVAMPELVRILSAPERRSGDCAAPRRSRHRVHAADTRQRNCRQSAGAYQAMGPERRNWETEKAEVRRVPGIAKNV